MILNQNISFSVIKICIWIELNVCKILAEICVKSINNLHQTMCISFSLQKKRYILWNVTDESERCQNKMVKTMHSFCEICLAISHTEIRISRLFSAEDTE